MRFLSLFSGIGGFDLGLEWAGWTCVGQVETNPYRRNILARHWPNVWRWSDVRLLDGATVRARCGSIDAVVGGPPCQPASLAGRRLGHTDRRWLWPEFLRLVDELRPRIVVAENPPGLVGLQPHGLDWVCEGLEALAYQITVPLFAAAHVGAPMLRERLWIVGRHVAVARGEPSEPRRDGGDVGAQTPSVATEGHQQQWRGDPVGRGGATGAAMAHADSFGRET